MKVLHVSDWHLGRMTYKHSRASDHDAVIAEIKSIAYREQPDLVCHTGDLFDQARPSYSDMAKGIAALQDLAGICPVAVVAGNHDSPQLFRLFKRLLGTNSRIHFITEPTPAAQGDILRFCGADGTTLRLGALPFFSPNRMVNAFDDPHNWRAVYADRVGRYEQAVAAQLLDGFDDRTEVAMFAAHLYVGGAHLAGSENHIADYYATGTENLPPVAYGAFGHIHKPQRLPTARFTAHYAGSPIQLDFGEVDEQKSVVLVDLHPGQQADAHVINLTAGRRLYRFDGTVDELHRAAPAIEDALCHLTIRAATHDPNLSEKIQGMLPDATIAHLDENCGDRKFEVVTEASNTNEVEPDLQDMFRDYLAEQGTKASTAERVLRTFATLFTSATDGDVPVLPEEALLTEPLNVHGQSTSSEVSS
jgi:DNA repair protein SbcD/Mre11